LKNWGAFIKEKKLELVFVSKNQRYTKDFVEVVFDSELVHFMDKVPKGMPMEDGTPIHCNKICEEWRQTCLYEKLNWLANSPNLNPIENLYKILKDVVQHCKACPRNLDALKVVLKKEWKSINCTKLVQLCYSMPSRL